MQKYSSSNPITTALEMMSIGRKRNAARVREPVTLPGKGKKHMSEQQNEQPKVKLFREKSLEAVESPEALNDYLRVTSPGVWLMLAAVIALLIGAVLWGVFGRIYTEAPAALVVDESGSWCCLPAAALDGALAHGAVTVDGVRYALEAEGVSVMLVDEETPARLLKAGALSVGDLAARVPVAADLPAGIYTGTVVTEDLKPMSLLIQ